MGRHTIVLMQRKAGDIKSRTYLHFDSTTAAAMGVVQVYESLLRELNPGQLRVDYELEQLYGWLDKLGDCSALVQRNDVREREREREREGVREERFASFDSYQCQEVAAIAL